MSTCNAHRRGPIKTLIEDMTSWEAGWVRGTARGMEREKETQSFVTQAREDENPVSRRGDKVRVLWLL